MSHFTNIKTKFQNLSYLKKALNRLNIDYAQQQSEEQNYTIKSSTNSNTTSLVISQSNGYDIEFCWNGQEYELIADLSYWKQPYSIESFIDKIGQQYASEAIIIESQKIGFQPIKYQQNKDGSNTLILERWNENNL